MFSIVVATDEKGGIGKDNKLLWNIPSDLKRFKEITTKNQKEIASNYGINVGINVVVMGRKTYDSIPSFLTGRYDVVITNKTRKQVNKNDKFLMDVIDNEELKGFIESDKNSEEELFVIGGASIYNQFLPYTSKIYLTEVKGEYNADTFFEFNKDEFKEIYTGEWQEENGYTFRFLELERINEIK